MNNRERLWLESWIKRMIKEGRAKVSDISEVDFEAYYDSSLSYEENKEIFADLFVHEGLMEDLEAQEEHNNWVDEQERKLRESGKDPELMRIFDFLSYESMVYLKAYIDELEGEIQDLKGGM
jgi:polyhydroxyalkanoate synthesis regulator phasin